MGVKACDDIVALRAKLGQSLGAEEDFVLKLLIFLYLTNQLILLALLIRHMLVTLKLTLILALVETLILRALITLNLCFTFFCGCFLVLSFVGIQSRTATIRRMVYHF